MHASQQIFCVFSLPLGVQVILDMARKLTHQRAQASVILAVTDPRAVLSNALDESQQAPSIVDVTATWVCKLCGNTNCNDFGRRLVKSGPRQVLFGFCAQPLPFASSPLLALDLLHEIPKLSMVPAKGISDPDFPRYSHGCSVNNNWACLVQNERLRCQCAP